MLRCSNTRLNISSTLTESAWQAVPRAGICSGRPCERSDPDQQCLSYRKVLVSGQKGGSGEGQFETKSSFCFVRITGCDSQQGQAMQCRVAVQCRR